MLHLGGAWNPQAVDAGSLAMDSREVCVRESRLAPVVKATGNSLAQKRAGAEIPARRSDCRERSVVSYCETPAESSLISTVADSSPARFGKERSRGSEVSYGSPDTHDLDHDRDPAGRIPRAPDRGGRAA